MASENETQAGVADDQAKADAAPELEKPNMDEQSALPKEETTVEESDTTTKADDTKAAEGGTKEETLAVTEQEDWRAKELRRKHAQIKERDRQIAEQNQKIADLEALAQRGPLKEGETQQTEQRREAPVQLSQAEIQKAAQALREQERYQEDLTRINAAGEKNFGKEWATSLENLATLGTVEMPTMQAILATDAPDKVLYELGKNPGEYQRIMDLPPARQANEFAKLALKPVPKPKVSSAPEPVETVRGRVTPSNDLPPDTVSDEEWYAAWNKRQAAKQKKSA